MYPISTPYEKKKDFIDDTLSPSTYLQGTNLHISKQHNSQYDFVEIRMPYLIMYQNINEKSNQAVYLEFSEQNRVVRNSTYSYFENIAQNTLHSHDLYELTYVMSGSLTMQIENECITYEMGDCCICNKNIHHKEVNNGSAEFVLIMMKEDFIQNVLNTNCYYDASGNSHSLGTFFNKLFAHNDKNPFFDAKEYIDFRKIQTTASDPCLQIINQMIEEISDFHSGKSHMMKALLCRFIEYLENPELYTLEQHIAKLSNEEQIIVDLTNVYTNATHILSRKEIETFIGYNGDHIERIIKKNTGKTLSEFGRTFILKKASILLMNTDLRIGEICSKLGYSNRNYFNKIFHKEFGCTPSEYRMQKR